MNWDREQILERIDKGELKHDDFWLLFDDILSETTTLGENARMRYIVILETVFDPRNLGRTATKALDFVKYLGKLPKRNRGELVALQVSGLQRFYQNQEAIRTACLKEVQSHLLGAADFLDEKGLKYHGAIVFGSYLDPSYGPTIISDLETSPIMSGDNLEQALEESNFVNILAGTLSDSMRGIIRSVMGTSLIDARANELTGGKDLVEVVSVEEKDKLLKKGAPYEPFNNQRNRSIHYSLIVPNKKEFKKVLDAFRLNYFQHSHHDYRTLV